MFLSWLPCRLSSFLGYSKLLEILWTKFLQQRLDAENAAAPITVLTLHPGGVDTFTHKWPLARLWRFLGRLFLSDTDHGAYTSVFAAAGKKVKEQREKYKASYLLPSPPGKITAPRKEALDPVLAEQLHTLTEKFLESIDLDLDQ